MTILLLTRPEEASRTFLAAVEAEVGKVRAVISPVMEIVPLEAQLPKFDEVILTSANGAKQVKRLGVPAGTVAWCVGKRTADEAKAAGLEPISAGKDAEALIELVLNSDTGRLCHIRGTHARGQVATNLTVSGKPCSEVIAYDQRACAPSDDALIALSGTEPVLLPLFSPRSAMLIPAITSAPVHVIAMSANVAAEVADLGVDTVRTAMRPDFDSMLAATCRRWNEL